MLTALDVVRLLIRRRRPQPARPIARAAGTALAIGHPNGSWRSCGAHLLAPLVGNLPSAGGHE